MASAGNRLVMNVAGPVSQNGHLAYLLLSSYKANISLNTFAATLLYNRLLREKYQYFTSRILLLFYTVLFSINIKRTIQCSSLFFLLTFHMTHMGHYTCYAPVNVNHQGPTPCGQTQGILIFEIFFCQSPHPHLHILCQNPLYFLPHDV